MKNKNKILKKQIEKRFNNIIFSGQKGITLKIIRFRKSGNLLKIKYKLTMDLNAAKYFATLGKIVEDTSNAEKEPKETKDHFEI